eukprot:928071-Alexandrium_andersonii.AAC.1
MARASFPEFSWQDGVNMYRFFFYLRRFSWSADVEAVTSGGFATEALRKAHAGDLPSLDCPDCATQQVPGRHHVAWECPAYA